MVDYTAIIVAMISLIGTLYQSYKSNQTQKKNNIAAQITAVNNQVNTINARLLLISESEKYMLQDRLLALCKKYLDNGKIGTSELKSITHLYNAYHDLGGNEFITNLYERVEELPIKKQEAQ